MPTLVNHSNKFWHRAVAHGLLQPPFAPVNSLWVPVTSTAGLRQVCYPAALAALSIAAGSGMCPARRWLATQPPDGRWAAKFVARAAFSDGRSVSATMQNRDNTTGAANAAKQDEGQ